jgi:putative ABC transport system ATP-binding protein
MIGTTISITIAPASMTASSELSFDIISNTLMPSAAQPVVSLVNVSHSFGDGGLRTQVLFDVSAEIWPGELVMVMGPSGSGKTTMLNLVGALRRVAEGSLSVLGTELRGASHAALQGLRKRIGFIFQQHHLLDSLTARQNVQMGVADAHPTREARRRAQAMLAEVGLAGRENAYPKQLSGGQRQRVAAARALVREPELLLADEPTASLDSQTGREIMELLRRLARRRGCAVLTVTHDARILDIADRLMYLEDGRLSSFASVTSPHAAHLFTALGPLVETGGTTQLMERTGEAEFLEMLRTLGAEAEQFLNALDLGPPQQARRVTGEVTSSVLRRVCSLLEARAARIWMDSGGVPRCLLGIPETSTGAPRLVLEALRSGKVQTAPGSLFVPLPNREYEIAAVAEIAAEGGEAERACRDFARPLGLLAQLCARLENHG